MRITGLTSTTAKTYFNNIVGIGKTNPTYNLDVSGNCVITSGTADTNPSLTIIKDTGTAANFCIGGVNDWQHRAQLQIQDVRGNSMVLAMSTDGVGIIQGKQSGDGNYRHICINQQTFGNFGIGTLTPASKLDVSGDAHLRGKTYFGIDNPGGGAGDNAYIEYTRRTGEATTLKIVCDNDSDDHISLMPSGNVGIKTLTPTATLDVSGTVNATSYNATSDYRVKTDVKPLDASFNVDVFKPVTYTNIRHGRQDVGFIAHEVQEHYPFLVNGEKDGEHMQSLNYIGLIGILTKEIQDLKRRLAETEAKVASVETDVRTIDTKVEEVGDIIISVEDTVLSVKNAVSSVENKVSSFDNKVSSFDNKVSSVENKVSSVENKVSSVENTVLLEQARLTICETDIALNKSAIKDLDERFQS